MKTLIILISALASTLAMADSIEATCSAREETHSNADLLDTKLIQVQFDEKNISFERQECKEDEVAGACKMTGVYEKITKNGSSMYSSDDLLETADQTDYAYIFVSPELAKGKDGEISFSIRQLGDSEGAWWITETFDCKVNN